MSAPRARVLIVDDDPGVLRAAERVLAPHHEVLGVRLPDDALSACRERWFDLCICDIRMPVMDGFTLMQRIREISPQTDFIVMTGSLSEPDQHLVRALREKAFYFVLKPFHREVLRTLVERCLELRALREAEARHARRMEDELGEARSFQRSMLAPETARIGRVTAHAACRPCSELGGDLYDYFALDADGERIAFLIADVRGHGAGAALLTATVKAAFRSARPEKFDPLRTIDALVEAMRQFGDDRFVTAVCGVIDAGAGELSVVNAGHPAPMLRDRTGAIREIDSTGPLVCWAFEQGSWELARVPMGPGCSLLLYTDGLAESRSSGTPGEGGTGAGRSSEFGRSRIAGVVSAAASGGEMLEHLLRRCDEFRAGRPLEDDLTVLTFEIA